MAILELIAIVSPKDGSRWLINERDFNPAQMTRWEDRPSPEVLHEKEKAQEKVPVEQEVGTPLPVEPDVVIQPRGRGRPRNEY